MSNQKEASARIKINKLLEESGWRFEDNKNGKANIQLEPGVKYTDLGDDFENDFKAPKKLGINAIMFKTYEDLLIEFKKYNIEL